MNAIENDFDFDTMFSIMKNQDINLVFKAKVCNLMLRLHVDRDPLERMFFPQMIKTVKDIETFDRENVILFQPSQRMIELKSHVLDKLMDCNGIIKI